MRTSLSKLCTKYCWPISDTVFRRKQFFAQSVQSIDISRRVIFLCPRMQANDPECEDDGYDKPHQRCEHQSSSLWSTPCIETDDDPVQLSASVTVMSSKSRDNVEAVEEYGGLQQISVAQSVKSHPLRLLQRRDHGRLQALAAGGGGQMNVLDPLIVVIDSGVRKIISFARQVPGFDALIVADQICLIKRQFPTISLLLEF